MTSDPTLSIVVTIVDGGETLGDFLRSLRALENAPSLEVIVPYDASVRETAALLAGFPDVTPLDIGRVETLHPLSTQAGQHELYDRRRAAGLAVARGRIICILEDRGHPRADWAANVVRLHAATGHAVIGGAIACREPVSRLNWAIYVADFGRYSPPFESGPAAWVTDVNVSYSRKAIEDTRHIWKDRFHEPLVHSHLIGQGDVLFLSNEVVVNHRRPAMSLGRVLRERFEWGRLFGYIRTRQFTPGQRLIYIVSGPLIPPVLWLRHALMQKRKGRGLRYLASFPYLILLTTAWTAGEVWGYVTKRP